LNNYIYLQINTINMGSFLTMDELNEIECSLQNRQVFRKLYNSSKAVYIVSGIAIIMFIYQFI
jgi:hypothetical protein